MHSVRTASQGSVQSATLSVKLRNAVLALDVAMAVREVAKPSAVGLGGMISWLSVLAAVLIGCYVAAQQMHLAPATAKEPSQPQTAAPAATPVPKAPSYHAVMTAAAAAAAGPRMPWEEEGGEFLAEQLDEFGHAFRVRDFLTSEEVAHVRSLASDRTRYKEAMPGSDVVMPNVHFQFKLTGDDVVANISARIGRLTGIPPHSEEDYAAMTVMRPWCKPHEICPTFRHDRERASLDELARLGARRSGVETTNLHHDHNQNPRRVVTVIVYLSGGEEGGDGGEKGSAAAGTPLEGGETLFPCVRPPAKRTKGGKGGGGGGGGKPRKPAAAVSKLCAQLVKYFNGSAVRHLVPHDAQRDTSAPGYPQLTAPEAAATYSMCSSSATPPGVVRYTPLAGSALLFLSASAAERRLLEHMWHGGCRVRKGQKVIIQQFKSLPSPGHDVALHPAWAPFDPLPLMPEAARVTHESRGLI